MADPQILDKPLPKFYSGWKRTPWVIVVHYSAGYTAEGCHNVLDSRGLSVHATIERDGVIWREVADENRAIHAGYGRWGGVSNMNHHAFGFEIVNFGWAEAPYDANVKSPHYVFDPKKSKDTSNHEQNPDPNGVWYRDESYKGSDGQLKWTRVLTRQTCEKFPDHRDEHKHKLWATYPDAQLKSVYWLIWQWVQKYKILPENIIGHEHVTPHKKLDPSPAFPWHRLEAWLKRRYEEHLPELLDVTQHTELRIKAAQSHVDRMGYNVGEVDGVWGPNTEKCIKQAIAEFGPVYGFEGLEVSPENVTNLCNAFRLVPGFDPGRT